MKLFAGLSIGKIVVTLVAVCLLTVSTAAVINLVSAGEDSDPAAVSGTDHISAGTTTQPREEVVLELPYYIEVDKIGQVVSIYTTNEEGKYEKLVRQLICSTGERMDKLPDGYYPLKSNKHKWNTMLSHNEPMYAQYTTQITGSYLFHSVPYSRMGDNSSLYEARYAQLGTACSGGCIRLTVEGAKWIYDNCPEGTVVRVFKGEQRDEALLESLRPAKPVDGWDPTDPDPDNPDYRPIVTTPDPQPDKYAPLYDYQWNFAPEQSRIYPTKTTTTTEAPAEDTTTAATDPIE